jgi:DNA helicase-2/ATP-dependent DNA helicase PcrA
MSDQEDDDILSRCNPEQRQVVLHRGSPLLVFAAAGTGKTHALTSRLAHIIKNDGVQPDQILGMTFTRKAAREMRARAAKYTGVQERDFKNIGTFHSTCIGLLRIQGCFFSILDQKDALKAMKALKDDAIERLYTSAVVDGVVPPELKLDVFCEMIERDCPCHVKIHKLIYGCIAGWRNEGLSPEEVEAQHGRLTRPAPTISAVAAHVYVLFRKHCMKKDVAEFNDLIILTIEMLRKDAGFASYCRQVFHHLLVDEFQDTNPAQMKLIRLLTGPKSESDEEVQHNLSIDTLVVVGDDYQAIHGWRGACITNITSFHIAFPTTRTIYLRLNYRSLPPIIDEALKVILMNKQQQHKPIVPTRLLDEGSTAQVINVVRPETSEKEAQLAAELARQLSPESEMAILYRRRIDAGPIKKALQAARVPFEISDTYYELFSCDKVKVLLSYARLATTPESDPDFRAVYNTPSRGLGQRFLEAVEDRVNAARALTGKRNALSLLDAARMEVAEARQHEGSKMEKKRRPNKKLAAYGDKCAALVAVMDRVTSVVSDGSLATHDKLRQIFELCGHKEADKGKVYEKLEPLFDFAEEEGSSIHDFLTLCDHEQIESYHNANVHLMTLHKAKGLEFPLVFIAGCNKERNLSEEALEEERRLYHTGITRARDQLFLSAPKVVRRRVQNKMEYHKGVPLPFLPFT